MLKELFYSGHVCAWYFFAVCNNFFSVHWTCAVVCTNFSCTGYVFQNHPTLSPYFQLSSRCLEIGWNTASCVWCITWQYGQVSLCLDICRCHQFVVLKYRSPHASICEHRAVAKHSFRSKRRKYFLGYLKTHCKWVIGSDSSPIKTYDLHVLTNITWSMQLK